MQMASERGKKLRCGFYVNNWQEWGILLEDARLQKAAGGFMERAVLTLAQLSLLPGRGGCRSLSSTEGLERFGGSYSISAVLCAGCSIQDPWLVWGGKVFLCKSLLCFLTSLQRGKVDVFSNEFPFLLFFPPFSP